MSGQDNTQEQDSFLQVQNQGNFQITPCKANIDFDDKKRFQMLKLNNEQKMQISELLQHIPTAAI